MITGRYGDMEQISIHALREEGDRAKLPPCPALGYFYPRPPRGGRLPMAFSSKKWNRHFYPRPPRGGRHFQADRVCAALRYFYPRPPRGGRPVNDFTKFTVMEFLSTPSARRATVSARLRQVSTTISIHALREEGDHSTNFAAGVRFHFYPRPPRGGRRFTAYAVRQ